MQFPDAVCSVLLGVEKRGQERLDGRLANQVIQMAQTRKPPCGAHTSAKCEVIMPSHCRTLKATCKKFGKGLRGRFQLIFGLRVRLSILWSCIWPALIKARRHGD